MLRRDSPPATEPSPSVPSSIARKSAASRPGFTRAVTRYRIDLPPNIESARQNACLLIFYGSVQIPHDDVAAAAAARGHHPVGGKRYGADRTDLPAVRRSRR